MTERGVGDARSLPRIIAARRTPVTVRGGRQRNIPVDALAAEAMRAVMDDLRRAHPAAGSRSLWPDDILLGNCMGPGGNPARVAVLRLCDTDPRATGTPGSTIDRQCGSGLAAIAAAAHAVRDVEASLVLAGGAESPSTAPPRLGPDGVPYARAPFAPPGVPDPDMLEAAQTLADRAGIPRSIQDAFAARSHRLTCAARDRGELAAELTQTGTGISDDGPREDIERLLVRFTPLLGLQGTLTAGNSSRNADGAAMLAIANPGVLLPSAPGLAVRTVTVTGGDPALPGLAAADAIRLAIKRSGREAEELSAIELVEAFASQALAVLNEIGLASGPDLTLDPRVNARGGTLALGHPWGASGAIIATRLFHRLVTAGAPAGAMGLAAAAIGGGMGIAMIAEVVR